MQGKVIDKILTPLAGIPVVCHSVNAFIESGIVNQFTFVYRDEEQKKAIEQALTFCDLGRRPIYWTLGGAERQDSVFHALTALSLLIDIVFIHDCARPLIHPSTLQRLMEAVIHNKAAVVAHRVTDTIKKVSSSSKTQRQTLEDIPRADLWAMENTSSIRLRTDYGILSPNSI